MAFTDDDCLSSSGGTVATESAFADSELGFVSGPELPDRLDGPTVSTESGSVPIGFDGLQDPEAMGPRASSGFRREAVTAVRRFDDRLDAGVTLRACEDKDIFWRLLRGRWVGACDPGVVVRHLQWCGRTQVARTNFGYGLGAGAVSVKVVRLEGHVGWRMLINRGRANGTRAARRAARSAYEQGVIDSLAWTAGVLFGAFSGAVLPPEGGRFRSSLTGRLGLARTTISREAGARRSASSGAVASKQPGPSRATSSRWRLANTAGSGEIQAWPRHPGGRPGPPGCLNLRIGSLWTTWAQDSPGYVVFPDTEPRRDTDPAIAHRDDSTGRGLMAARQQAVLGAHPEPASGPRTSSTLVDPDSPRSVSCTRRIDMRRSSKSSIARFSTAGDGSGTSARRDDSMRNTACHQRPGRFAHRHLLAGYASRCPPIEGRHRGTTRLQPSTSFRLPASAVTR